MAREINIVEYTLSRVMVISTDTEAECDEAIDAAARKGWTFYQKGRGPNSGQHGAWMTKTKDQLQHQGSHPPASIRSQQQS